MPGRILINNMTNNKTKTKDGGSPLRDLIPTVIGEVIVVALVCLGFAAVHFLGLYPFSFQVVLGALLGALVIIANHALLIFSVDREIKKFIAGRPEGEMSDEDVELYAKKKTVSIQNAIKISSMIRTVSILAMLVIAFVTGWFNPIATAIPMFAFRFIITVAELIKSKNNPKPDPSKFIKYEDEDENTEEKEEEDN